MFAMFTCGQDALPGNSGGKWSIMKKEDTLFLPESIQHLSLFDSKGLACFIEYDRFGILSDNGARIHQAVYQQCKQLGNGLYECSVNGNSEVIDFSTEEHTTCTLGHSQNNENWFILNKDSLQILVNISSGTTTILSTHDKIVQHGFGYILIKSESGDHKLYCPDHDPVELSPEEVKFLNDRLIIDATEYKAVIFPHRRFIIPGDSRNISVNEFDFHYTSGGFTFVINHLTGRIILKVPFDKINKEGNYYIAFKNGLKGLLTLDGKVLAYPKYLYLKQQGDFFHIGTEEGNGILSSGYKELLPCKYYYIYMDNRFYYVCDDKGFQGLIGKKGINTILECKYDYIRVSDNTVRAWLGKKMVMLTLV